MWVYLESRDLINLIEKSHPCSADQFRKILEDKAHQLVVSRSTICEISYPLLVDNAKTNVMRLLNQIEAMPLRYIAEGHILPLELKEALNAFSEKREFRQVSPFVNRFDQALMQLGETSPTKIFLNLGLGETVFMLWKDGRVLEPLQGHAQHFRRLLSQDRKLSKTPTLKEHFIVTIERDLTSCNLPVPEQLREFGQWIYEKPTRCPSKRLRYEIFHSIRKNIGDIPKDTDIVDFFHIQCLPYVDLITLDRRMRDYMSRASHATGLRYDAGLCADVQEVLDRM